ncbi:MAG: hypothetical protein OXI87_20030 [Albidovulum sp.]|nr:hypothetical protein [Albidovulum sp.]
MSRPANPVAVSAALCCFALAAQSSDFSFGGHIKFGLANTTYPVSSRFREWTGASTEDFALSARLNLDWSKNSWGFRAEAQIAALGGDSIYISRNASDNSAMFAGLPNDDHRLFDLTRIIADKDRHAALVRLDRLSFGYTGDRGVIRFGRQAVTWGNGLIFNTVMDIFNPFDPTALDKEYKPGDDMLYGQYLRENGDDLQAVLVFRRNPATGEMKADHGSFAAKYHGFSEVGEHDVLVASHYGESLVGFGGNRTVVGEALWRGDFAVTFVDDGSVVPSAVTSLTHSFELGGRNVIAALEYYFNGFGQRGGRYDTASLQSNQSLLKRIARGEMFNLGRHYVGLTATIEISPLFLLTPNLFMNVEDRSVLLQLAARGDIGEEMLLLGSLNVPVGPTGTEFGGIASTTSDLPSSIGPSLSVQLSAYF